MSDVSDTLRAAQEKMDDDEEGYVAAGFLAGMIEHDEGHCGGLALHCLFCLADQMEKKP